ncbi:MAG: hypothetical protein QM736_22860 [Vicinamibacterales bacterium]
MIIAAIRTVATYVAVSLYVLLVGPLGMLLAILFHWKRLLYVLGHLGVRLALFTTGISFRVHGREHLPLDRAAVYCSNHQSNVDPPGTLRGAASADAHPLQARDRSDPDSGARVPSRWLHPCRPAQSRGGAALDRERSRRHPLRQLFPHLSRRDAEPVPTSSCRSRREGFTWRSSRRRRSSRLPFAAGAQPCSAGAGSFVLW